MAYDIRNVKDITDLITYFAENLDWSIDIDDFEDIEDITFDFSAKDIGLQEDAFAKISSLKQLRPLVDGQPWGIFCVEFDSNRFEVTALRKILSGLVPKSRNSANHAVWDQHDLLFLCFWGSDNERTIGIAHFQEKESGLPQIRMISCAPAKEDFTQISVFEERLSKLRWPENKEDVESWKNEWSSAFTTGYHQVIRDASTLTSRLAVEAQGIRNRILEILDVETTNGYVHLLYDKFKNLLIHDMTESQFADMYAQTVVYGLFSARCMDQTQENFSADEAIECIPNTNPFLRSLMEECFGTDNSNMSFDELEIENVVDLLRNTNTTAIIEDFNRQTGDGREDPVIYFYEYFLSAYDKEQKVKGGDFYTPQPIVNFIVRSVDLILKTEFGISDGMASEETKTINIMRKSKKKKNGYINDVPDKAVVPAIQILDPATGTGTFIRQTILQIYKNFCEKHKEESREDIQAAWNKYVPEHLLPRLNAFEIKMAPYAVAHMKLAFVLRDTGYDFSSNSRLQVYLTNTLEEPGSDDYQYSLFDDALASESIEANRVKKNNGINIVLGNPPYAGESINKSDWILGLLEDYKKEPGGELKLQEKNPKWLNDDYVKFIRYAQEIISRSGSGIMAYICAHGFLDNPTFRGMRWRLLAEYDKIYVLNLHGNSNRKEVCPDGSKDENVFEIAQGVCIIFAIKNKRRSKLGTVYYADLYGTRQYKYDFLQNYSFADITFTVVSTVQPQFYFVPRDFSLKDSYDKGFSIKEMFPISAKGFVTARDSLTLHDNEEEVLSTIEEFAQLAPEDARVRFNLDNDAQDWKVAWAQEDIKRSFVNGKPDPKKFCKVSYREFTTKYSYYTGTSRGFYCRPRKELVSHLSHDDNIALVTVNRQPEHMPVGYYFVADHPVSNGYIRSDSVSIDTVFPLFLYDDEYGRRTLNLNKDIIDRFAKTIDITISEQNSDGDTISNAYDVFDYIYAILYTPGYRHRFSEFLKIDFPKIPYPQNKQCYWELVSFGRELRETHLLKSEIQFDKYPYNFEGEGNFTIEKTAGAAYRNESIFINASQRFTNVPVNVWNFYIGGYQPLKKWIKDNKGKRLDQADIDHYISIIIALNKTIDIMEKLDQCFDITKE